MLQTQLHKGPTIAESRNMSSAWFLLFCLFYKHHYFLFVSVSIPFAIVCRWNCMSDKWLESEWIIAWRPLMRPQWKGRVRLKGEKGVVGRWKQLQLSSKRNLHPPLYSPSVLVTSLFLLSTFHLAAPPPCFHLCTYPFSWLFPQHSPILSTDAWHSTCSVLCAVVLFYYRVKWQKNPYLEPKSIWWLQCCLCADVCGCMDASDYICFISFVVCFCVCFGMLGILGRVFEST